jgi:hypothetical protein
METPVVIWILSFGIYRMGLPRAFQVLTMTPSCHCEERDSLLALRDRLRDLEDCSLRSE